MKTKLVTAVLTVAVAASFLLATRFRHSVSQGKPLAPNLPSTNLVAKTEHESLRSVIDDYHSTNIHKSMTSAIAHQLIAEQLRTKEAFYEWATNVATTIIVKFVEQSGVPIYGTHAFSGDALQFDDVTVNSWDGLFVRAIFDPDPTKEGPLEFEVEGGVHPYIMRVRNAYRTAHYQLDPSQWTRAPRNLGHLDWSKATSPLDENQVEPMLEEAFRGMTGLDLNSFHVHLDVSIPPIPNPYTSHPTFKVITGSTNATLRSSSDVVYPFVSFSNDQLATTHIGFEGEMVQISPGRGEFVYLFAVERPTEAVLELGEKFLGKGAWEQQILEEVDSMNAEQRAQAYRRIFAR